MTKGEELLNEKFEYDLHVLGGEPWSNDSSGGLVNPVEERLEELFDRGVMEEERNYRAEVTVKIVDTGQRYTPKAGFQES